MKSITLQNYLLLLFMTLLLFSCRAGDQAAPPSAKKKPLVTVQPAMVTRMVSFIDITGTIEPNIYTDIESPAEGIIEQLAARENQRVEKDKIIAVINPSDRVALVSNSKSEIERIQQKLKASGNTPSDREQLLRELEAAEKNLDYALRMYQTIPVISPMSGLVTRRWTDIGSQVSPTDKILTISDMNSLVIKAEVNERYFEAVSKGKSLQLTLNAYPDDSLQGVITLVYPQINPDTRSVKFDIKIQNFYKTLLPGMMASVKIPVSVREKAVSVPEQAVLTSPDNKNFLFVVRDDTVAYRLFVETGIVSGNNLEILNGLNENDLVVVAGQEMLKDKTKVMIMNNQKGDK
ncbi:MAG: efflux RND transporter periplasmic adaptor subunit [Bacteroidales bacterium]|nr:efflux RND transporter periplasmic adaptor subunit [Bacteroidales bacterium]